MVHKTAKAKQTRFGTYATVVPLILVVPTLLLFVIAGLALNARADGWLGVLVLLALCTETFFLPYILVPIAIWLPTRLPWVSYRIDNELGNHRENRLVRRVLISAMILLPGLPALAAYDSEVGALARESSLAPLNILVQGGIGTVAVFALMAIALAIPNFVNEQSEK